VLSLVGLLGLTGCATPPPPSVYQLQAGEPAVSAPRSPRGVAVLLGPIGLPDYLKHETLVQRQADGHLQVDSQAHWAGRLQDNVNSVLLHRLATQLNSSRLVLHAEREGFRPEVQAIVRIDRLDSGPEQPAVLEAQWRLLDAQGEQRTSRILRLQELHAKTTVDQVRAQSLLLQQLSEQLARDIQWTALEVEADAKARAVPNNKASKGATSKKREEEPKDKPSAAPLRTDMEVFRF